jgi:RNA polymerase sigma factor (sigma-70 family)
VKSEKDIIYLELLVLRCRRGETTAWEELVRRWEKPLFYYVRRLIPDEQDSWDVMQELWLKAFRGLGSLHQAASLPAWLYQLGHHTAMTHLRDAYSQQTLIQDDECLPADCEPQFAADDAERVHFGLNQIALPLREVLTLHFLEDFSVSDVAQIVGIPEGTVKSRIHHAKRALRGVLEKESIE